MAQGDGKNFNDFVLYMNQGDYDDADTLALVFASNTYSSIDVDTNDPTTSDLTIVSGGNVAASYTLSNVSITRSGVTTSIGADNIGAIEKDDANPSPLTAAIVNVTAGNKLYKVYDLTTDGSTGLDLVNNRLTFTFNSGIILQAVNSST